MKFSGIMIGTDNPQSLGDFYTKIFGKPGWQNDDWYGFAVGTGNVVIGPHSEVKGKSSNPERLMMHFDSDDVPAEFARLKSLGAAVVAEPYQPNKDESPDTWLATLADPDGNYFQLATPWKE